MAFQESDGLWRGWCPALPEGRHSWFCVWYLIGFLDWKPSSDLSMKKAMKLPADDAASLLPLLVTPRG
jgi:hypothetical protein